MKLAIDFLDLKKPFIFSYKENDPPLFQPGVLHGDAIKNIGIVTFSQETLHEMLYNACVDDGTGEKFLLSLVDSDVGRFLTTHDFDIEPSPDPIGECQLLAENGFTKEVLLDLIHKASFGRVFN